MSIASSSRRWATSCWRRRAQRISRSSWALSARFLAPTDWRRGGGRLRCWGGSGRKNAALGRRSVLTILLNWVLVGWALPSIQAWTVPGSAPTFCANSLSERPLSFMAQRNTEPVIGMKVARGMGWVRERLTLGEDT